jgi:hypothetical protein
VTAKGHVLGDIEPDRIKGTLDHSQGTTTRCRAKSLTKNPGSPRSVAGRACKCRMRRDQPEPGCDGLGPRRVSGGDFAAPHPGMSPGTPFCRIELWVSTGQFSSTEKLRSKWRGDKRGRERDGSRRPEQNRLKDLTTKETDHN